MQTTLSIDILNAHCGSGVPSRSHVCLRVGFDYSRRAGGSAHPPLTNTGVGRGPGRGAHWRLSRGHRAARPPREQTGHEIHDRGTKRRAVSRSGWSTNLTNTHRGDPLARRVRGRGRGSEQTSELSPEADDALALFCPTSDQARLPAEFKHINKRRKRD